MFSQAAAVHDPGPLSLPGDLRPEGCIYNYVALHFHTYVVTSVALHVHGGGLVNIEHVRVEETNIAHHPSGYIEPFLM